DGGEVHDEEEVLVEAGTGTAHAAAPHCSVRGYTGAGTNTRRSSRRVVPAPILRLQGPHSRHRLNISLAHHSPAQADQGMRWWTSGWASSRWWSRRSRERPHSWHQRPSRAMSWASRRFFSALVMRRGAHAAGAGRRRLW